MKDWLSSFKAGAWLLGNWQLAVGIAGGFALWSVAIYFIGRDHGYDLRASEQAAAVIEAQKIDDESEGEAATEREADRQEIDDNQEARDNAIEEAQSTGAPSAASNALNCERLRRAGADLSQFPACRGRSDGSQTAPRP